MQNFMTIYQYELKKIVRRKMVWITLLICILCIAMVTLSRITGDYYVDGTVVDTHYHMFQVDKRYQQALSGRAVAQELLEEMTAAYAKIPATAERYSLTEEYQTYARPYSAICNLVWVWIEEHPFYNSWKADEQALYESRAKILEDTWQELFLSETEKEFWRTKEAEIEKPFVYFYHEGYLVALREFVIVGLLLLLFTSVSMSVVFTEEHVRRTDQIILSSAKGKDSAYWAKILAGISVSDRLWYGFIDSDFRERACHGGFRDSA
ncbi:MAG: hypothetical protein NC548_41905 [Lachnospiraceae bacterium]|nr:hypothetical protein [Lachnospiraceae bacterium]